MTDLFPALGIIVGVFIFGIILFVGVFYGYEKRRNHPHDLRIVPKKRR